MLKEILLDLNPPLSLSPLRVSLWETLKQITNFQSFQRKFGQLVNTKNTTRLQHNYLASFNKHIHTLRFIEMRKHLSYRQFDERLRTFSQWLYFCIWLSISSLIYFIYCGRTYSHHRVNTNNLYESNTNSQHVQGASKKMHHSDFSIKSVPGVGFHFFRGVLESEFRAQNI